MTDTDRQRLAAILGMLGSEHQGERDAAAIQAEAFRRKHRLTWAELLAMPPPVAVAPEPPQWTPPPPPGPDPFVYAPWVPPELTPVPPAPDWTKGRWFSVMWMGLAIGCILILIRQFGFG